MYKLVTHKIKKNQQIIYKFVIQNPKQPKYGPIIDIIGFYFIQNKKSKLILKLNKLYFWLHKGIFIKKNTFKKLITLNKINQLIRRNGT